MVEKYTDPKQFLHFIFHIKLRNMGDNLQNIEHSPLALKLSAFVALSAKEFAVLERLQRRRRAFAAGQDLVHQGQSAQAAYIISSGWASSYKLLSDGSRQIIDLQIPGDFVGLRSVLLHVSDHSVQPVVDIEAVEVFRADLLEAFSETPRLAAALFWAASRDEAMVVEKLVGLGLRSAEQRMAHFLIEIGIRLALIGMGTKERYACPLTQFQLADALGLSAVHVNRVLRHLRETGLATFQRGQVTLDDYDGLVALAQFDPEYLDHTRPILN